MATRYQARHRSSPPGRDRRLVCAHALHRPLAGLIVALAGASGALVASAGKPHPPAASVTASPAVTARGTGPTDNGTGTETETAGARRSGLGRAPSRSQQRQKIAARAQAAALDRARKAAAQRAARAKARQGILERARSNPRAVGRLLAAEKGWSGNQFGCLDRLWTKESGWRWNADNPTSDAYGIPQSLPGSKMASGGSDWLTNPVTQIQWGLKYISNRYGTPCAAWSHSQSVNWY